MHIETHVYTHLLLIAIFQIHQTDPFIYTFAVSFKQDPDLALLLSEMLIIILLPSCSVRAFV